MLLIDRACFERGCACYDSRDKGECVEVVDKRTWQGLTDEEFNELDKEDLSLRQFVQAIEAKLKEKNSA